MWTVSGTAVVVAAGLRLSAGRLALLQEFRFTRWGNRATFNSTLYNVNQTEFLLGIAF
jgi:hypothetical protein